MTINGAELRENFDKITNGIKYSIDYLKSNFSINRIANLPFSTLIVPLSVYFAVAGNQESVISNDHRAKINSWFWKSAFSKRYSSGVLRNLKSDIEEMKKLRDGKESSLGTFSVNINREFFLENVFGIGNVNSKTLILLLASGQPRSLISGQPVDLGERLRPANRSEFHHVMPRKFLSESGQAGATDQYSDSVLANIAFLNRSENRELGGASPSVYRSKLPLDLNNVLSSNYLPNSLFTDCYVDFLNERADILLNRAKELMA